MRHPFTFVLAVSGLLGSVPLALAQPTPAPQPIAATNAWARATPGASKVGAAYVTLTDNGQADQLTGASTPVAATAELHETRNQGGVMQMRPVPSLALEPGKPVTFTPGGYHVMLMGLKQPLKQGDSFPLTLTFAHAQPVTVQVKVSGPGAAAPMPMNMPGMKMN